MRNEKGQFVKGFKHSEEWKKNLSIKLKDMYKNGFVTMKGKKLSEETKLKISLSNKGHVVSDITRKKLSIARQGKVYSDKTKEIWTNNLKHYKKENHPRWRNGRWVYRDLAKEYGMDLNKCQICKEECRTVVHHINGNKYDNTKRNLSVLCYFCHNAIHNPLKIQRGEICASII